MKKIIFTIIVVILTIFNMFLFKDYYRKSEKDYNKISQKYLQKYL